MREETTHRKESQLLLDEAFVALEKGDLRRASKRGWDAAAHMLKAVAQQRGWEHGHESDLYSIVSRLRLETRNPELTGQFSAAKSLRLNSNQRWFAVQDVEDYLRRVDQFLYRLENPLPDSPKMATEKQLAPPGRVQSRLFLSQARLELSKGYLVEASEYG